MTRRQLWIYQSLVWAIAAIGLAVSHPRCGDAAPHQEYFDARICRVFNCEQTELYGHF
jgi:hypothetical protein